jgi:hypothetical protein
MVKIGMAVKPQIQMASNSAQSDLPSDIRPEMNTLIEEYLDQKSIEARLVKSAATWLPLKLRNTPKNAKSKPHHIPLMSFLHRWKSKPGLRRRGYGQILTLCHHGSLGGERRATNQKTSNNCDI